VISFPEVHLLLYRKVLETGVTDLKQARSDVNKIRVVRMAKEMSESMLLCQQERRKGRQFVQKQPPYPLILDGQDRRSMSKGQRQLHHSKYEQMRGGSQRRVLAIHNSEEGPQAPTPEVLEAIVAG
jgi:hypothetical protein